MNDEHSEPIQKTTPELPPLDDGVTAVTAKAVPAKPKRSKRFWRWLKEELKPDFTTSGIVSTLVTIIATALVVMPIFIFLHRIIPFAGWTYGIDRMVLFIVLFLFFFVVFKIIKKFVWVILGLMFTGLLIGTMTDHYGFEDVYPGIRHQRQHASAGYFARRVGAGSPHARPDRPHQRHRDVACGIFL